jgi:hypothetical protein
MTAAGGGGTAMMAPPAFYPGAYGGPGAGVGAGAGAGPRAGSQSSGRKGGARRHSVDKFSSKITKFADFNVQGFVAEHVANHQLTSVLTQEAQTVFT